MAGEEVGRVGSALGPLLAWTPFLPPAQVAGLLWPADSCPASLCFSLAPGSLGRMPAPSSPIPHTWDRHVLVAAALWVSRPPGAGTAGPRGLETTNDSLLTGCWLPPACQPFPLHTADNHVRQGNPSCPWSCDLNLNFALLSSSGEARFRL